mgnify:CR=1 FL=1
MYDAKENPEKILLSIKTLLSLGVEDRQHCFHTPVFSNITKDLSPSSRIVVLRNFDTKNYVLSFHTDYRSKKILEIQNKSQTFFTFYDKKEKTQLRIQTNSSIQYNNRISLKAWKNTKLSSRKCYLTKKAPSSKTYKAEDGLSAHLKGIDPKLEESEKGYNNFAVITSKIKEIDWLYLSSSGHIRLRILIKQRKIEFNWLIP